MAIIVEHKKSKKKYVLLGSGLGAYKATRPSFFGGNLFPHEEEEVFKMVAVADIEGEIRWFYSKSLKVIEVDCVNISQIDVLKEKQEHDLGNELNMDSLEKCPACNSKVELDQKICHECGLVLLDDTYDKIAKLAKKK